MKTLTKRNNRKILTERKNEKHMVLNSMSPMCSYNHGEILGSG